MQQISDKLESLLLAEASAEQLFFEDQSDIT